MATKSGELREMLLSVIDGVVEGKIEPDYANSVAKLAGQINQSLKIEIEGRQQNLAMAEIALGAMSIGDEG